MWATGNVGYQPKGSRDGAPGRFYLVLIVVFSKT
jgi:hypothetical protein